MSFHPSVPKKNLACIQINTLGSGLAVIHIAANNPPKNQFLFHTLSPILGMGSSYTAAMAQKRSINSAGRRQCHFKQLKMALSSTSRVNKSFLSHCCVAKPSDRWQPIKRDSHNKDRCTKMTTREQHR